MRGQKIGIGHKKIVSHKCSFELRSIMNILVQVDMIGLVEGPFG